MEGREGRRERHREGGREGGRERDGNKLDPHTIDRARATKLTGGHFVHDSSDALSRRRARHQVAALDGDDEQPFHELRPPRDSCLKTKCEYNVDGRIDNTNESSAKQSQGTEMG